MLTIAALNYRSARQGSTEVAGQASDDLRQKTEHQLVAVRDLKKAEITDYFGGIRDQVITMSSDRGIVRAMQGFTAAFNDIVEDRGLAKTDLVNMHGDLRHYYENEFGAKYRAENDGTDPSAYSRLSQLPAYSLALQHAYLADNGHPLGSKHLLDDAGTGSKYDKLHSEYHPTIRNYLDRFGYYDIFLVDARSGNIVYSVYKELDFSTSLRDGPYSSSNIGRVFQKAVELPSSNDFVMVDFECYWPSYEAPASFIASPIFEDGKAIGVLIFQMPIDRINDLMKRDAGLGETGETILIAADGRQRCDSTRDPSNHSLTEAFRNSSKRIDSDSVEKAILGQSGIQVTENYLGETVLSAYAPVPLLGVSWAIVTEVTKDDALASIATIAQVNADAQHHMMMISIGVCLVATFVIVFVAWLVARSLVRPIRATVETLHDIAEGEGDLTRRLDENQVGELAELAKNFNRFITRLQDLVGSISGNACTLTQASQALSESAGRLSAGALQSKTQSATVSSAAEELSINMQSMAGSTEEMSSGIDHVAKAVSEMKQTIAEIAVNAEQSAEVASQAAGAADISNQKVNDMGNAANEIGMVISVIQDIAEQTNLLALNATIEAARAGDAGKGFAVVATEVKQLAKQTADATDDIRRRIETMQRSTGETVDSITQIGDVIRRVNELSRTIASAVEEQSITTQQIAEHVGTTAELAGTVARGVAESANASREITENISHVDAVLQETADNAGTSNASGEDLLRLAGEMRTLVDQFKIDDSPVASVQR